jgi:hypothetical protein
MLSLFLVIIPSQAYAISRDKVTAHAKARVDNAVLNITTNTNNAQITANTIPATMTAGQTYNVSVTVKNTGTTTWTAADGYKLCAVGYSDPFTSARKLLGASESIAPNQSKTFYFAMKAPAAPGTYTSDWRMLREGVCWIGETLTKQVAVELTGTFTATGSMNDRREMHTATLLPNGKVLITGGQNTSVTSSVLQSAELYDPATGAFTATGSMGFLRKSHTATLLPDSKVLIAGGEDGSFIKSGAKLYDPATGIFTTTGSMSVARRSHTATLLPSGKVLIAGGTNTELYDPATGTFTVTGSINASRYRHTATLLSNGKVLIAGGRNSSTFLIIAESYEPSTGIFTATGSMNVGRCDHTATLLSNGKVLITGGYNFDGGYFNVLDSVELYN